MGRAGGDRLTLWDSAFGIESMSDAFDPDVGDQFAERLLLLDDSLACVATIHLCVEYWINRLICEQAPMAADLLGRPELRGMNAKLAIVCNMSILPAGLCRNVQKLNELKARCAQRLDVDFTQMDLAYDDPEGNVNLEQFRDRLISGEEDTAKAVLRWVGLFTFGWLSRHCVEELGMEPQEP